MRAQIRNLFSYSAKILNLKWLEPFFFWSNIFNFYLTSFFCVCVCFFFEKFKRKRVWCAIFLQHVFTHMVILLIGVRRPSGTVARVACCCTEGPGKDMDVKLSVHGPTSCCAVLRSKLVTGTARFNPRMRLTT